MNPEILFLIITLIGMIAVVGIAAWLILRRLLKPEALQAELQRQQARNPADSEPQFPTEEIQVTVLNHTCEVRLIGTKTPKSTKIFTVVFRREENGDILSFRVPEEMYDGFEIGQRGTLTVVDGALYGFALDE